MGPASLLPQGTLRSTAISIPYTTVIVSYLAEDPSSFRALKWRRLLLAHYPDLLPLQLSNQKSVLPGATCVHNLTCVTRRTWASDASKEKQVQKENFQGLACAHPEATGAPEAPGRGGMNDRQKRGCGHPESSHGGIPSFHHISTGEEMRWSIINWFLRTTFLKEATLKCNKDRDEEWTRANLNLN